jgi:hypothetical protein
MKRLSCVGPQTLCAATKQGYNHTWFVPDPAQHSLPGSRLHAIYSVSWASLEGTVQYPLIWDDDDNHTVNAFDVTEYYIHAAKIGGTAKLASLAELDRRTEYVAY